MGPSSVRARWRSVAERTLVIGALIVFPLLLLECGSRLYLWLDPPAQPTPIKAYLSSRPPAYDHADYFSREFVLEVLRCVRLKGSGGLLFRDFQGKHINVIGGFRRTTDQPTEYANRIRVFGASPVFSRRVPDRETIPSHLQRLVNARTAGRPLFVENLGLLGLDLGRIVSRVENDLIELSPGDTVIFYGGIGEIFVPLFVKKFGENIRKNDEHALVQKINFVQAALNDLLVATGDNSAAVRLLARLQAGERLPDDVEDEDELAQILEPAKARYEKLLVRLHRHVSKRGGAFYNFLQPNLFVTPLRSPYEEELVESDLMAMPGLERALRAGYPMLRQAMASAASEGVVSFDVTDAFLDRPPGVEIYFDYAHVNHVANELMAQRMFESIFGAVELLPVRNRRRRSSTRVRHELTGRLGSSSVLLPAAGRGGDIAPLGRGRAQRHLSALAARHALHRGRPRTACRRDVPLAGECRSSQSRRATTRVCATFPARPRSRIKASCRVSASRTGRPAPAICRTSQPNCSSNMSRNSSKQRANRPVSRISTILQSASTRALR